MSRNDGRFRPGNPGRPKGSLNKTTLAIREFARSILEDPTVRANLLTRARRGQLAPAEFTLLHYYGYGRPRYEIQVDTPPPDPERAKLRAILGELTRETREQLWQAVKRQKT